MTWSFFASFRHRAPARALTHTLAVAPLAAMSLACLTQVDGDRARTHECPDGETCSAMTPAGLTFLGRALFDLGETPRLGPIVEGGTLEVGLIGLVPADRGTPVPHEARVDGSGVLAVQARVGDFEPLFSVDSHVLVRGRAVGEGSLRIVDPSTGALHDRTPLRVVGVDDVRVVSATDPDRGYLYAGCNERIGVRLLSGQNGIEVRAIDDSMTVRIAGVSVEPEPTLWDCVLVAVPEAPEELSLEIHAGGRDFVRTIPVRTLEDDGLRECPASVD
ncbi:MAG: hypothetical protein ACK6CU_13850 [Deltaproteobacteria bacterium]|jgi:hypothetical protein